MCYCQVSSVMACPWTSQHMTPSTAIEGSKTFSLALSQKSLVKQSVRAVHEFGTPLTKLLRFTPLWPVSDFGVELTLGRTRHIGLCNKNTIIYLQLGK